MTKPQLKHALKVGQMAVDYWNEHFPVGTPVVYYSTKPFRHDQAFHSKTRSPAWVLANGEPVVQIGGKAGGLSLEHVIPKEPS